MIRFIIYIYIYIIILDAILSYMPDYQKYEWAKKVKQIAGFTINPIRDLLPKDLPFDLSPVIVIVLLQLFMGLW